ncbi:MAG: hypothetical protein ABW020_03620 [Candidatus Rokuibacteriota bacterium]
MDEALLRLGLLVRVLVPFVFMMATVYLATHILFARIIAAPQSQVLWFFTTVTGPLTRPVRALLPRGTAEPRVRAIALAVYLVLWVVSDRWLRGAAPVSG